MPIQFEEVTGQIDRSPPASGSSSTAPSSAPNEDIEAQLDRSLRMREERAARICAE
jgi:hypothetical protein